MKLAYFTMPLHPPQRNYTETLKEDREAIILADQLGYEEAYIGEHVTDKAETITSSLLFLASLIHDTKRVKLGSGTVNLANWHPATVATSVAMLDHMAEGRFIFGISPGGLKSDAEVFGNLDLDRNAMFVEAIDHILAIWERDAPYNIEGKFWNISTQRSMISEIGQGIMNKPYQRPHPPIVVTVVAPFSKGVIAAAKRGWDPISANFLQPKWVASHWPMYVEGCQAAGRPAAAQNWRIARSIFVADDEDTAQAYAKSETGPYGFYFRQLVTKLRLHGRAELFKTDRSQPDESITLKGVMDDLVICGTPESVADQILAFRETVGDFGTLVYAGHDWMDPGLSRRSMRLMAEVVMPKVNAALRQAQPVPC